uniref:Biogenesis of lysosome-related organelles complex 1 subunit 1 n=1 Tax=Romanomermis culicivorax TaxID=13658 RepID=A0A915ISY0_ROMCU
TSFHGKWALYITDEPTITVANPAQTTPVTAKPCELAYKKEIVNPLQLKPSGGGSRINGQAPENGRKLIIGRQTRQLRIKPKEIFIHGSRQKQVTIDCNPSPRLRTAKCVSVRCPVKFLAHNGNATVTIISRLWNSTFVEDYRDVQDIDIISRANITVSIDNPIEESDYSNNYAFAVTKANPDAPTITEQAAIPLWIIILAILGGILLLLCITLLLWKCGFFNRRHHRDEILYKAEGMLSSLLKEHIAKQNVRKESLGCGLPNVYNISKFRILETCKNEALKSANHLTNTVIDALNSRVSVAYSNQRKLDVEAKKLQANVTSLVEQTAQWAKLVDNFNHVLKEIGDVETWSKSIEKDMSFINSYLENAYKCQQNSQ